LSNQIDKELIHARSDFVDGSSESTQGLWPWAGETCHAQGHAYVPAPDLTLLAHSWIKHARHLTMSDPPPTKPKPGSLRDRIAAFESKGTASAPTPAPVPRPKPGGISWKPKPQSPPTSPGRATGGGDGDGELTETSGASRQAGGMSAADAKESIGLGGSLKERMAALQGRGAFGAPRPTSPPPKPTSEKPKWKPPPRISKPADADDVEAPSDDGVNASSALPIRSPPATAGEPTEPVADAHIAGSTEEGVGAEVDEEEQERQRRAAIAARIARLGGARVGMGPPIFGKKPDVKKPEGQPEEHQHETDTKEPKLSTTDQPQQVPAEDDIVTEENRVEEAATSEAKPELPAIVSPPEVEGITADEGNAMFADESWLNSSRCAGDLAIELKKEISTGTSLCHDSTFSI
jgi:myosin tail region-interacting protein MTI1